MENIELNFECFCLGLLGKEDLEDGEYGTDIAFQAGERLKEIYEILKLNPPRRRKDE